MSLHISQNPNGIGIACRPDFCCLFAMWCEWKTAQSLRVACRLLIECVETKRALQVRLCLIDECLECFTTTVTVVESEPCCFMDDKQMIPLGTTVLHPMGDTNLCKILRQSLCVSKCVFGFG